jgi:acetyl-CoA C-acetyltransferase
VQQWILWDVMAYSRRRPSQSLACSQVLCTLKAWESETFCSQRLGLSRALGSIDPAKLNVTGSSLALGHPFAATGARLIATLAKLLAQRGSGRGLISICTAGGMGVTAILER